MNRLICILLALLSLPAWAHKTSNAFVYVDTDQHSGRVDVAVSDLLRLRSLDANSDARVTYGEIEAEMVSLQKLVATAIDISEDTLACALSWKEPALTRHLDEYFVAFRFDALCPTDGPWRIQYRLLFEQDSLHRGLLSWHQGESEGTDVFTPERVEVELVGDASVLRTVSTYFDHGVTHLLIGYDHLLFLLALLLPVIRQLLVVPTWSAKKFSLSLQGPVAMDPERASQGLTVLIRDILVIVTLFTVAHSVTLALSALDVVKLPSALIEVLIALSVSAAGLVALVESWHRYRRILAFGFGLIHGFGFANVLGDLTVSIADQVWALAAFNVGVEAGQVLVILLTLPLVYLMRALLHRLLWLVNPGAMVIVSCGLFWALQRL